MKNIFNKRILFALILPVTLVFIPFVAYGAIVTNPNPTTLNDGVQLMVNVAQWILGIVGSLTLLMFVVGGFMFLISAGNSQTVEKGKSIIIGAVIGLIIVFCSYMIIKFSMSALGLSWKGNTNPPSASLCDQQFGSQGYSCMVNTSGNNCKNNLCLGMGATIKCCLPN